MEEKDLRLYLLKYNIFEDNEYFNLYIKLILKNVFTKKERFKTSCHHILPKSFAKKLNIPVDNSKNNTVNFLHKDHALAHYYIALCTKDDYFKYSSISALQHIIGFNKKMNQEDIDKFISNLDYYQELIELRRKQHSIIFKGKLSGENNPAKRSEVREKIRLSKLGNKNNLGKKLHDENWCNKHSEFMKQRCRMIDLEGKEHLILKTEFDDYIKLGWIKGSKQKGIPKSSEYSKKVSSEINKGCIRITNGEINKNIRPEQFEEWEKKGFWKGLTTIPKEKRKPQNHISQKGRICIHKPEENKNKFIKPEELDFYIQQGYVKGGIPRKGDK